MAKYTVTRTDGTPIPSDEPCWVFRAKDMLALPAIRNYRALAVAAGLPVDFLRDIDAHIERVMRWQGANGAKLPD